jgi:hypothetical protein
MQPMIKYYFTTFGEVYAGFDFSEMDFPDLKIIVQKDKLREYQDSNNGRTTPLNPTDRPLTDTRPDNYLHRKN